MNGRIQVIRKTTKIVDGRRNLVEEDYYSCFCKVQSLSTKEKYEALQTGLESVIVFKARNCRKLQELRLNLKEFYATYNGTEFKIYDATPTYADNGRYVLLKCRAGS